MLPPPDGLINWNLALCGLVPNGNTLGLIVMGLGIGFLVFSYFSTNFPTKTKDKNFGVQGRELYAYHNVTGPVVHHM